MKFFLLTFLISLPALAQLTPADIHKVADTLENPAAIANNLCSEEKKKENAWCSDLEKSICAVQKTETKKVGDYDHDLQTKYVTSLPATATAAEIARAKLQAITAAETETAQRTTITAADNSKLMGDVKASLINQIRSSGFPKQREDYMVQTVSGIVLQDAKTYIDKLKAQNAVSNPRASADDNEVSAITSYTDICGDQGMGQNAFYDSVNNAFVLCPGLIQSASEYGRKKEEVLTGLTFTIGHEIGHSIDGQKYSDRLAVNKVAYAKMGECYKAQTPSLSWEDQRGEIVGDYWGVRVLAERIKAEGRVGDEAFMANVLAMDGLCASPSDTAHPAGTFRMNNILARDPVLRAQMECEAPTPDKPFCSLTGAQPPKPRAGRP